MFENVRRDLRDAVRSLTATPIVTAAAILSLALAIGANTAIFSIANSLLLRPLPVRDPGRLVLVTDTGAAPHVRAWSNPFWEQMRQRDLFAASAAWSFVRFNLAAGGETRFVEGLWVSGSFAETLGVRAVIGRPLTPVDDQRGGGPEGAVAVISHAYWQRAYGGANDVPGRKMRLNGVPFTIVGVTAPDFFGPEVGRAFDVMVPIGTEALVRGRDSVLAEAANNFLSVIIRLDESQTREAAAAALRGAQAEIRAATIGAWSLDVADRYLTAPLALEPAAAGYSTLRRTYERPVVILGVVVALVLAIGCANVANLLLARATARRQEMSPRLALGASRWRLARQLLVESALLAAGGTAFGILLAAYGSDFLVRQLSTPANRVFLDLTLDARVLTFTLAVTMTIALLFGTAPAMRAARAAPIDAINEHGRSGSARMQRGLAHWLVPVQVALSLVLIVVAGLFVRSFASLATRELGFESPAVLVATVDAQRATSDPAERLLLVERGADAVRALPNVAAAAVSFLTPIGGGGFTPALEIAPPAPVAATAAALIPANGDVFGNLVSPHWFATFGTPLIAGREFADADRRGAQRVAIVNETFARRFLGDGSPLGRTITLYPRTPRALGPIEIVGVAADAVYGSARETAPATWFVPIAQFDLPGFSFATIRLSVRTATGTPQQLTTSVTSALATVNPQLSVSFRPLAEQVRASLTQPRMMAQLAGFFGVLALLLAALGLYGVTAYTMSRRRTEIAIRMALGAQPTDAISRVVAAMSRQVAIGVAAGLGLSLWASQLVGSLLVDLDARDPLTLAAASLVLLTSAAIASWLPARRAVRIDPVALLRRG